MNNFHVFMTKRKTTFVKFVTKDFLKTESENTHHECPWEKEKSQM